MEVISTLINAGVDMNAIIVEVYIANSYSCMLLCICTDACNDIISDHALR